jgi:hypothetical protein
MYAQVLLYCLYCLYCIFFHSRPQLTRHIAGAKEASTRTNSHCICFLLSFSCSPRKCRDYDDGIALQSASILCYGHSFVHGEVMYRRGIRGNPLGFMFFLFVSACPFVSTLLSFSFSQFSCVDKGQTVVINRDCFLCFYSLHQARK